MNINLFLMQLSFMYNRYYKLIIIKIYKFKFNDYVKYIML